MLIQSAQHGQCSQLHCHLTYLAAFNIFTLQAISFFSRDVGVDCYGTVFPSGPAAMESKPQESFSFIMFN